MASFTDSQKRPWQVNLSVSLLKRIKLDPAVAADLLRRDKGLFAEWGRISGDVLLLTSVLWLCVQDQAKAAKVDQQGFEAALGGPELEAGHAALQDSFLDFCQPEPWRRTVRAAFAKSLEVVEAGGNHDVTTIGEINPT